MANKIETQALAVIEAPTEAPPVWLTPAEIVRDNGSELVTLTFGYIRDDGTYWHIKNPSGEGVQYLMHKGRKSVRFFLNEDKTVLTVEMPRKVARARKWC